MKGGRYDRPFLFCVTHVQARWCLVSDPLPASEHRYGRAGFKRILEQIAQAWQRDREKIVESSVDVIRQLQAHAQGGNGAVTLLNKDVLDTGFFVFRRGFDSRYGGFGGAPKFPRPVVHSFLLRYYARTKNPEALEMVANTLREMAKGGMKDQLGGGFHRYSVDARWFGPHLIGFLLTMSSTSM